MKTKICPACGKRKLIKFFYKSIYRTGGVEWSCKKCICKYRYANFKANTPDYYKTEYWRKWKRDYKHAWVKRHPGYDHAQYLKEKCKKAHKYDEYQQTIN